MPSGWPTYPDARSQGWSAWRTLTPGGAAKYERPAKLTARRPAVRRTTAHRGPRLSEAGFAAGGDGSRAVRSFASAGAGSRNPGNPPGSSTAGRRDLHCILHRADLPTRRTPPAAGSHDETEEPESPDASFPPGEPAAGGKPGFARAPRADGQVWAGGRRGQRARPAPSLPGSRGCQPTIGIAPRTK